MLVRAALSVLVILGVVFVLIGLYMFLVFFVVPWNWEAGFDVTATPPLSKEQMEQREIEQERRLAFTPRAPQWFSDGNHIAVSISGAVYVIDSAGSRLELIDGSGDGRDLAFAPSISPDSSRIAYAAYYEEPGTGSRNWEIVTANPDGSAKLKLTDNDTLDINPVWSPDGTHIAFAVSPQLNGPFGISVIAADGSELQPLVAPEDLEHNNFWAPPAWSPDGSHIAIQGLNREGERAIYVVAEDGTGLRRLADYASPPAWSPDGRSIAFAMTSTEGGLYSLYTIDPDGSDLNMVAQSPFRSIYWSDTVSWSPDGSAILLGDRVFPIDGSAEWQLPWPDNHGAWSPDGSRIAVNSTLGPSQIRLYTVAKDGSDGRVLVEWDEDSEELVAAGGKPLP